MTLHGFDDGIAAWWEKRKEGMVGKTERSL